MTNEEKIERDRQRREDELILLLLLLSDSARRDVIVALRHGFDPAVVLIAFRQRAALVIAASMADAHADAYARLGKITGAPINRADAGARDQLESRYLPAARVTANNAADSIVKKIGVVRGDVAVAKERVNLGVADDEDKRLAALTEPKLASKAFDLAGYTKGSAFGLDLTAEIAVVSASNVGMIAGAMNTPGVTGLHHISVMDDHTTEICIERHDLKLPVDDPYWQNNVPALHYRCRSIILPIVGEFVASTQYPVIPPMAGFGTAPAGFIESFASAA